MPTPIRPGRSVSVADMQTLYLQPDTFQGEWYYSLLPPFMLPQESLVLACAVAVGIRSSVPKLSTP